MDKKNRILKKLKKSRKQQVIFFLVTMTVLLVVCTLLNNKVAEISSHRYTVTEDKDVVKYIEEVNIEGNKLTVSGWCFYKDADSSRDRVQVFLRNVNDDKDIVWLDVEDIERKDVDEYYDCEVDYSQTGFEASTKLNKLDTDVKDYEIFIKLTYFKDTVEEITETKYEKTVSTDRYICKGVLTAFKPGEDTEPVMTVSEELNEVFKNGQLLVHREDFDMYVYQYGGKIYWVAGEDFYFEEDGSTYIQFQLDTTRSDRLPEIRLKNEWYWDNIGFNFEIKELKEEDTSPYRVTVCDIPTSYPITYFWTGYHNGSKWIWQEYLNIDFRMLKM